VSPAPSDDAAFRQWRAECIEQFREVNLETEDLMQMMPFRAVLLRVSKRLMLTRTCAILESPLYTLRH